MNDVAIYTYGAVKLTVGCWGVIAENAEHLSAIFFKKQIADIFQ
jgi:hypothetical protein